MQSGIAIASVLERAAGLADDWTGALVSDRVAAAGCRLVAHLGVPAGETELRQQLVNWISDPAIDVVFVTSADFELAHRAVQPLVTEAPRDAYVARCGATLVVTLPAAALALASAELDRVVATYLRGQQAPVVAKRQYMTTGSIAVIGDIPVYEERTVDLRGAGRRGLWAIGLVALAATASIAAVGVNIVQRNRAIEAASPHLGDRAALADPPDEAAPPAAVPVAPPVAPRPAVKAHAKTPAPPKSVARPHANAPRPAPARPHPEPAEAEEPAMADEMCDEVSCAAHDYERECCTPFRPSAATLVPGKLDRQMVASTMAPIKQAAHGCATASSVNDGSVKVAVTVRADGRVGNVIVQDAPEVDVGGCVADAIRATTFPITASGGSFVLRFDL